MTDNPRTDHRLYAALIAAGMEPATARGLADNMGRLPGAAGGSAEDDDIRIVILDATTCLVHGKRVVSVAAALEIMKMLRAGEAEKDKGAPGTPGEK